MDSNEEKEAKDRYRMDPAIRDKSGDGSDSGRGNDYGEECRSQLFDDKIVAKAAAKTAEKDRHGDSQQKVALSINDAVYYGYESTEERRPSLARRVSRGVSDEWNRRRRSSLKEQLPQTTHGWAIFLSTVSAIVLRYELRLQKSLTCPPSVYGQVKEAPLRAVHEYMTRSDSSILVR